MKTTQFAWCTVVPGMALGAALCLSTQRTFAQDGSPPNPAAQSEAIQPDHQDAPAVNTFSGRIVRSGNKIILTDPYNKTTYQLDDQQKARGFLNKNVKVNGVLDPSTGTIRVTAIEPV